LAFREVQAQGTAWICNVFEVPKLRNILQKLHSVSVKGEEQSHTRYPLTPAIASKEVDLYWFLMSNRKQSPHHLVTLCLKAITIKHDRSEITVAMLLTIITVYPVPRMQQLTDPRRGRSGADALGLRRGPSRL
jgi:hypothetical protein